MRIHRSLWFLCMPTGTRAGHTAFTVTPRRAISGARSFTALSSVALPREYAASERFGRWLPQIELTTIRRPPAGPTWPNKKRASRTV